MEKNILPAAKRMAENDNWTLERLKENLKDTIDTQKKFLAKEIPPRKIIGTGYKAGQSRRIATKYLEDRIAEYEQAIELKEKPKNSKRVKDYSYIKRSDISVLKATIDGKVLNVDPKDILSGTYVAGKIKPTAKKLRVAKIDASKLREKILKTYKDFAEEEYDKAYEPLIRVEDLKQFIEYGLTEEMIMVFYCGWKSIMKVAIDGEFTFGKAGGIFDLRTEGDYIKNHILRALKNCENNTFELGFKYPQLNWEKYGIKNPKTDIIDSAPYDFFGKKKQPILRIETFTLKPNFKLLAVKDVGEVVDSKRVAKYGEDDLIDSTKPMDLNYGYLCLVSRNLKEIFALAKKIIGDKDGYVKDFDWLVQEKTWGGEMLEESNYKFKKGGTLETVKNNADKYLKKHGVNIYIEQKQELAKDLSNLNRDERYYVIYNDSIEAVEVIDQKFFDIFRGKTSSVVGSKSFTVLSDYINGKRTPKMPHVYSMEHYVQKANLGALMATSKLAPKTVNAVDSKMADKVSQKTFMEKMRETGSHKYSKGGNTQVAETIASQLGGTSRLKAFTGAYNFGTNGSNLFFRIKNRKVNYVKITLNGKDLYDLEFGRIYGSKYSVVKEYNDIYFDQLVPLFEENTGMYLKFAKGGEVIFTDLSDNTQSRKIWESRKSKNTGQNSFGSFAHRLNKKYIGDYYLYRLDDFDEKFYSHIPLKNGEILARVETDNMVGGEMPLVKINLSNGRVYFMSDDKDDKNPKFDRASADVIYLSLDNAIKQYEKFNKSFEKGGEIYNAHILTDKNNLIHRRYTKKVTHEEIFKEYKDKGVEVKDSQIHFAKPIDFYDTLRKETKKYIRQNMNDDVDIDSIFIASKQKGNEYIATSIKGDTVSGKSFSLTPKDLFEAIKPKSFKTGGAIEDVLDSTDDLSTYKELSNIKSKLHFNMKLNQKEVETLKELGITDVKYRDGGNVDFDVIAYAKNAGKEAIDWMQELKNYAGEHYDSLTPEEKDSIISELQMDYDFSHSYAKGGGLSGVKYISVEAIEKVELKDGKIIENTYTAPIYSGVRVRGNKTAEQIKREEMEAKGQLSIFKKGGTLPSNAVYIPKSKIAKIYTDEGTFLGENLVGGVWYDNSKTQRLIEMARKRGLLK